MSCILKQKDGKTAITVYAQPRSSRNRVAGLHNDALKLCITSPPVDGKANKAVINLLADLFNIPKTSIEITSGQQNRTKTLTLGELSLEATRLVLNRILETE